MHLICLNSLLKGLEFVLCGATNSYDCYAFLELFELSLDFALHLATYLPVYKQYHHETLL